MDRRFYLVSIFILGSLFISMVSFPGEETETEDEYESKIKDYDRALQVNPDDADAWLNKGIILKKMGKHAEGARCIEKAIDLYVCR